MMVEPQILKQAQYWAESQVFDAKTRAEVADLLTNHNDTELTDRFYKGLEFGTAGLRGILGAGTSRMNLYNIRKATAAVGTYLNELSPKATVGITYDSRHYSREFAQAAAGVLAALNINSLITKDLRPVPLLSFMVREFNCAAGICITASHNPPEYNGFKVYWSTGGQIVPPHDANIINHYNAIKQYEEIQYLDFKTATSQGFVKEISEELDAAYLDWVQTLSVHPEGREHFRIAFTPLHGTAGTMVPRALSLFGFKDVHSVAEQLEPNGDFPTVSSPNPGNEASLNLAKQLGEKINADLILGTDPDCDRVGIMVPEGNSFRAISGNDMGTLLTYYLFSEKDRLGTLPNSPLFVKSIVTTDLQARIAEHFGAKAEDTLTGFKWIADRIEAYESGLISPHRQYICGGEEAYGFLAGTKVRDKDGIGACCLAAEMVAYYKSIGKSLSQVLIEIFEQFGIYRDCVETITLTGKDGAQAMARAMSELRTNPPTQLFGNPVLRIKDIQLGEEKKPSKDGWKSTRAVDLPASNVLQLWFSDGTKLSIRPSGTEPLLKFYLTLFSATEGLGFDDVKQKSLDCDSHVESLRQRIRSWLLELSLPK